MKNRTRNAFRVQLLALVAGFVVLAVVVGARSWLIERQRLDNEAMRVSYELQRQLTNTLLLLQDAETGQRGYVLTADESYLQPYDEAMRALPAQFDGLMTAFAADPSQAARVGGLRTLMTEKLAELQEVIDLRRRGDTAAAVATIRSGRGKAAMDEIREVMRELRQVEQAEMDTRMAQSEVTGRWLRLGSVGALAVVLLMAMFGITDARRRVRDILAAHREVEATNATLVAEMASRAQAEGQVRQLQKMEAVGQLTGGIAHDFNNMLAVILSALNLMQRKLARGETDIGQFVDAATDATRRAADLTGRLLAFARQQPLNPQVIDANRLISGMSDLLRRTLGEAIEIETVLAGGLWRTTVDTSQLENAVVNLAVNARDAMEGNGRLTIETANCHLDDDYAATHHEVPAGQYVLVAVTDTGAGMSPETAARAFDPFFTTKEAGKGTGLGLSQVFGFVKQSGGHVKIYSELGQGTTVKIYLPRHFGEEDRPREVTQAPRAEKRPDETILVVEDDDRVRKMSVAALRELGYEVVVASSAAEALVKLDAQPGIDLMFTDIVMPGMNGRQLADEALKRRPDLKLIFTTGFTRNAVVHNGVLDHGVNFLAKPFSVERLALKIREVLDEQ
jgi:signal transduction histidine kinase/ActR/RegA family two-component response regulator